MLILHQSYGLLNMKLFIHFVLIVSLLCILTILNIYS